MKFWASEAQIAADEIVNMLRDHCEKIEIAGSLRRRRLEVSDVEIVFVPKFGNGSLRSDLFSSKPDRVDLAEITIAKMLDSGLIKKRLNSKGNETWGRKNKLARHALSAIPVDLFTATADNFYNYLVCRTGPTESNILICESARARGWKWNPYGDGFSRPPEHEGTKRVHLCSSERQVFEFVDLPYKEPWER